MQLTMHIYDSEKNAHIKNTINRGAKLKKLTVRL